MKAETRRIYEELALNAIDSLRKDLDLPQTPGKLAAQACLSPFHFHRIFRALVGESTSEMARRLRLERAAGQVANSKCSITEIAFDAGYQTLEAFTRAFVAAFGYSPSVFRNTQRRHVQIPSVNGVHYDSTRPPLLIPLYQGEPSMNVEVVNCDPIRLAGFEHRGPYMEIGGTFEKLDRWFRSSGLPQTRRRLIGLYYDDPEVVPPDQLKAHACVELLPGEELSGPEGPTEIPLPGGAYARMTQMGPYSLLPDAWARLTTIEIPSLNRVPGPGISFEEYVGDLDMSKPESLRTDLFVPLR